MLAAPPVRWGMGDIAIGLGLMLAANIGVAVLIGLSGQVTDGDATLPPWAIVASVLANGVGFIGWPVVATWWKGSRSLVRDFGLSLTAGDVGWGVIGFLGTMTWQVGAGLVWLLVTRGDVPTNTGFLPERPGLLGIVAIVVAVVVVTPIAEELFFRGLALRAIARRWGPAAGIGGSAVVFGLGHLLTGDVASAAFIIVVTTGFGVILGALALHRNRLGAPIVAHVLLNAVAVSAVVVSS